MCRGSLCRAATRRGHTAVSAREDAKSVLLDLMLPLLARGTRAVRIGWEGLRKPAGRDRRGEEVRHNIRANLAIPTQGASSKSAPQARVSWNQAQGPRASCAPLGAVVL